MKGVEPSEAGWFTRLIYRLVQHKMGKLTGARRLVEPIKVMGHHPGLLWAMGQMEMGQEAAKSVDVGLKSLASVKVATLVGCHFCIDIGTAIATRQGLTPEKVADLDDFEASPHFSRVEKLVLRYAVAMSQTHVEIPEELTRDLQREFSPRQLVELTSSIAWENYRARFNQSFGLTAEGFAAGMGCPLPSPARPLATGHAS
ncbi:carboxymuconolactone decarboxylase family protein [Singulisphaera sp. PoT]|uniref:carboxymuconolactone decarboxylase family protein n=1 Tax=Singulisphaera sp. PoT TaxID=3411797 RepID=UPI003BF4677F